MISSIMFGLSEERQSAAPYDFWILIDVDGVINSGECTLNGSIDYNFINKITHNVYIQNSRIMSIHMSLGP